MLLYGHNLNAVVTGLLDTGQHIIFELYVRTHSLTFLSHTHMALVYEQRILFGLEILMLELILMTRIPDLSGEYLGVIVLYHAAAPGGNTVTLTAVPFYTHLIVLSMPYHAQRNTEFPITGLIDATQTETLLLLPSGEITYQEYLGGIGSPLPERPAIGRTLKSVIEIA